MLVLQKGLILPVPMYGGSYFFIQPKIADENGNEYMYLNPGSVSIPKEGSSHSYMVYEKGTFTWKNMSGEVYREWKKDSRF